MAATATQFGDGRWGIANDETGILIQSITHAYSQDQKTLKNRTGNDVGVVFYNEKVKIDLKGKVPKTSPFSGTIAASTTLGNALSGYLKGGVTGGLTLIDTINLEYNIEDYNDFNMSMTYWPNISS